MPSDLKLMCILAHPDDESLGTGGILARYASEGVSTYLVTATRGERGRFGDAPESPGPDVVGQTREAELGAAAQELGLKEVQFLGYEDGQLDRADPREALEKIATHIRRVRPQVVVTFGPEGAYGHPDHIAISQLATGAVVCAAGPAEDNGGQETQGHRVAKLYYMAWRQRTWAAYQAALKTLTSKVDGVERQVVPCPDWAVTSTIDTSAFWPVVWRAVSCHKTQMSIYRKLENLPDEHHRSLWGSQEFYRVFSAVNGGRQIESDLFEGLR
jgi:LmbE family N-acetylglucosaminyl deacetylase